MANDCIEQFYFSFILIDAVATCLSLTIIRLIKEKHQPKNFLFSRIISFDSFFLNL